MTPATPPTPPTPPTPAHPSPAGPDEPGRRSSGPPTAGNDPPAAGPGPAELSDLDRLDELSGPDDLAGLLGTGPEPGPVVRLRGGDELLAALPVLLGFHPAGSLVLVAFGGRTGLRVGLTVRMDLPGPDDLEAVCARAVSALATDAPSGAAVVVVGGGRPGPAHRPPPRADVAGTAQSMLVEAGIEPYAVLWAAGTRPGQPWACYELPGQDCGCRGRVPEAAASAVAAAAARRGGPVLPDRSAVGAVLAADGDEALRRRAAARSRALAAAAAGPDPGAGPDRVDEARAVLRRALDDAAACRFAVDDATVLRFCAAFDVPDVRDEAVRACLGPDAPAAEQVWAALSRSMPAPERADPAALFAVCALLRGDGALAAIAVERALAARPRHRLAARMDAALRDVTAPSVLRRALERDYGRP